MNQITRALARAFASLAHPRMLALMIWSIAVALLGIIVSLIAHVPVADFMPVIAGLAFIHYCIERLAELRRVAA